MIRAWIEGQDELYIPDHESAQDMAVFWGVLQGYMEKGFNVSIDRSTCEWDKDGVEMFEGDIVEAEWPDDDGTMLYHSGRLVFMMGSFFIRDDHNVAVSLAMIIDSNTYENRHKLVPIKVIGSVYPNINNQIKL